MFVPMCVFLRFSRMIRDFRGAVWVAAVFGMAWFGGEVEAQTGRGPKTNKPAKALSAVSSEQGWSRVAAAAAKVIEAEHYLRQPLDAQVSSRALERFFELLDPERFLFLQSDLEEFRSKYGAHFAAGLKSGNLEAAREIHDRYRQRALEYCSAASGIVLGDWEFEAPWEVEMSREKAGWPKDAGEAFEEWVIQVGVDLLSFRLEGLTVAQSVTKTCKRFEHLGNSVRAAGLKEAVAGALLALARACDAHSDYLTQEELEESEGELRLSRVGIGISVDEDPSGLRISGLMPGGPAQRDGRLRLNDRIVALAEEGGGFKELEELPFAQAVGLLRGKPGSRVRLRVAPARSADPSHRVVVEIRREELRSKEGEAYAKLVEEPAAGDPPNSGAVRMGWLYVPGFYGDDTRGIGRRQSSVSRDVGILLRRLIAENVRGIVLDLRGNLGGLLDEAIELGGLFCGKAPIAAVRVPGADLEVLSPVSAKSASPVYTGPLVVLVDRSSASASELLAGALQDYGRAVVVGGEQTFGKGSVQTTVALGEYLGGRKKFPAGGLALTVGKFYRISGQSTQLVGVRPDIVLPSTLDLPREGESALVDPLAYDVIPPVAYFKRGTVTSEALTRLRELSAARVLKSVQFEAVVRERDQLRKEQSENRLSLQESARRAALESAREAYARREAEVSAGGAATRFARVLLEDAKAKKLKIESNDPLAVRDPESRAVEEEVLHVLQDFIAGVQTSL